MTAEDAALVAVVVSVLSFLVALASASYTRRNAVAVEEANRLTRESLTDARVRDDAAAAAALKANVRVAGELQRNRYGTWHVQVINDGPAIATDVSIEITATGRQNLDLFAGRKRSHLRVELAPDQRSNLPLGRDVDSKDCPIVGNLSWQNQDHTSPVGAFTITTTNDQPPFLDDPN